MTSIYVFSLARLGRGQPTWTGSGRFNAAGVVLVDPRHIDPRHPDLMDVGSALIAELAGPSLTEPSEQA